MNRNKITFTLAIALGLVLAHASDCTANEPLAGSINKSPVVKQTEHGNPGHNPLDNQGGPDGFGYRYVDSQAPDTATYSWIELRGASGVTWMDFTSEPDDGILPINLGFSFPFYGATYSTVRVCTNGNLQFTGTSTAYTNACLPTTTLGASICMYWDDLNLDMGGYNPGGAITVGYKNFGDYFVIEFDSVGRYGDTGASFKFQTILWADGRIKMQYNQLVFGQGANSQTIGIQAGGAGGASLQYTCDGTGHAPVQGLAIWFYQGTSGSLSGRVADTENNPIFRATVRIEQLGISAQTDASGNYAFPTVSPGVYTVIASRPCCYQSQTTPNVLISPNEGTTVNFSLQWNGVYPFAALDVPVAITDQDTAFSTLNVGSSIEIGDVNVLLNINHTSAQDLDIYLTSPSGTRVGLIVGYTDPEYRDNFINTVFDDEATTPIANGTPPFTGSFRPSQPLSAMDDEDAQGAWTLTVIDDEAGDSGQLLDWEIHVTPAVAVDDPPAAALPDRFALLGNYPNPFNSTTQIVYALPQQSFVKLTLFNVLGQDVRTLVYGSQAAGTHRIAWDGRDARGRDLSSGLYLMRMDAPGFTATGKILLMR